MVIAKELVVLFALVFLAGCGRTPTPSAKPAQAEPEQGFGWKAQRFAAHGGRVRDERQQRLAAKRIPRSFNYAEIGPLRGEAREKLSKVRPLNLDQARRISGITPADIALVLAHLESSSRR